MSAFLFCMPSHCVFLYTSESCIQRYLPNAADSLGEIKSYNNIPEPSGTLEVWLIKLLRLQANAFFIPASEKWDDLL